MELITWIYRDLKSNWSGWSSVLMRFSKLLLIKKEKNPLVSDDSIPKKKKKIVNQNTKKLNILITKLE